MSETPESPSSPTLDRRALLMRTLGFIACIVVSALLLPLTEAEPAEAEAVTARVLAQSAGKDLSAALDAAEVPAESPIWVTAPGLNSDVARAIVPRRHPLADSPGDYPTVELSTSKSATTLKLDWQLDLPDEMQASDGEPGKPEASDSASGDKSRAIGGWTSILPPLIAILLALFFRRLIIALLCAVWLGAAAGLGWNPLEGLWVAASNYIWGSVADTFNIYIIVFTLALVGMVQVVTRAGGIAGILDKVSHLATSVRSTRLATFLMGGAIFFDDYANTIVVGTTMRPMADARRISREKLAYIVDSTSAPIAGIAIISTWIGYEVGLFEELAVQLDLGRSGYDIFFAILPLRFYCLVTLAFVALNAWLGRDYGPMLQAERRAATTGETLRKGSTPLTNEAFASIEAVEGAPHRWWNAAIPILFVIFATMFGMYWSGWAGADGASIPSLFGDSGLQIGATITGFGTAAADALQWGTWRDAFSNADNAKVLFWAAILGSLLAIVLVVAQRILSPIEAVKTWLKAVPAMWMAVAILILAWSIRSVCDDLGTSIYLVGAVQDLISPNLVPLLTFVLASIVAFSTGTSWGTMGILLPAMVPLAFYLTDGTSNGEIILLLTFGAVLDGAIFGDHCSPISDTTVMSSISASVDHIDHVRTQAPYAVTSMLLAATFGYVGVAFGLNNWLALLFGLVGAAAVLLLVGRPHIVQDE